MPTRPRRARDGRDVEILKRIYDRFNARDIDGVWAVLADDVVWAKGMYA
jgi:ketosteroid isomerase-like protein